MADEMTTEIAVHRMETMHAFWYDGSNAVMLGGLIAAVKAYPSPYAKNVLTWLNSDEHNVRINSRDLKICGRYATLCRVGQYLSFSSHREYHEQFWKSIDTTMGWDHVGGLLYQRDRQGVAIQFTGDNWKEITEWCMVNGIRVSNSTDFFVVKKGMSTTLRPNAFIIVSEGEMWVTTDSATLSIDDKFETGAAEWQIK